MGYSNDQYKMNPADGVPERCAAYGRFSSDLQRLASIEDQVRECRDLANVRGFQFLEEYVRSDEARPGKTIVGRGGLEDLVKLAGQNPRPFDRILFDDTSRLGRNLTDTLRLVTHFSCITGSSCTSSVAILNRPTQTSASYSSSRRSRMKRSAGTSAEVSPWSAWTLSEWLRRKWSGIWVLPDSH